MSHSERPTARSVELVVSESFGVVCLTRTSPDSVSRSRAVIEVVPRSRPIYGNVMGSTGSIIPLIWNFIKKGSVLELYGSSMTRFLIDVHEAIDLILKSVNYENCNIIPIAKSFRVKELFDIYKHEFGLSYIETEPRTGEKIHEIMASNEEIRRMELVKEDNIYLLCPKKDIGTVDFADGEYSSRNCCLSKDELYEYLKCRNFFKK